MQSINEDLLTELEKRDAAIQEAVGLICELEAKLEKVVSADRSSVRSGSTRGKPTPDQSPSQAVDRSLPAPHMPQTPSPSASRPKPKSQYKDVTREGLPESIPPPSKSSPKARALPPKQRRTPPFLQKEDPSTQALRNVYGIDGAALKSTLSLASLHRAHSNRTRNGQRIRADVDNYTLPSPRFSELSEGDFESVYGANRRPATPPHQSLNNRESISDEKISTRSAQRLSRSYSSQDSKISDWVQETRKSTSPARRDAPPRKSDKAYGSIEAVIGNRQAPPKRSPAQFSRVNELPPVFTQPVAKCNVARPTAAFGGPIFTGDILPPTPDTMSTSRLGTNRSNPSIVSEKSFVDKPSMTLDEFTKRVSERRPYTSESSQKGIKHDAPRYDGIDLEAEEEDPYLYTVNVPPRPPPHKVSDPSFSGCVPDHNFSGRPRLNTYSTDQPIPVARTVSYPASETTTRRRYSIQHSATSPDKSLAIPGPPLSEVYAPSDKSVNGGVPLLQQQQALSPSTKYAGVATKAAAGHSFKPLSIKNTGPSAMTRFFRRSSITTPGALLINQQQPQYQQLEHPSQQTRPRMTQEQSSAPGRRSSFQGVAKALRMGRPSTSDGDGATTSERTITAVGAVVFDNDDSQEDVTDGVTEGHDQKGGGARGIGLGIGKKLVGLGRRGSKGVKR